MHMIVYAKISDLKKATIYNKNEPVVSIFWEIRKDMPMSIPSIFMFKKNLAMMNSL